jgi:tRNA (guanine-N1)-methyltransferase
MPFVATVLTMFPEAFPGPLGVSLIGSAWTEKGLWRLDPVDIRAFSTDKRGFLDDTPAGGGPGQVLRADVVAAAVDATERMGRPLLYMSARGRPLTQARVKEWAAGPGLIVLCGRFEGVDQRVLDGRGFEEVSVGDAVLAGGEAAAMVAIEACVRLVPGARRGGVASGREFRGWAPRRSAVHTAADVRRRRHSRGAAVGPPRRGGQVAAPDARTDDPRAAARPLGRPPRQLTGKGR